MFSLPFFFLCACMRVSGVHVCAVYVHTCERAEAGGWHQVSCSVILQFILLRQGLSLKGELD